MTENESTISFRNSEKPNISQFFHKLWRTGIEKTVEYFENESTIVKLVSFDESLESQIEWIEDGQPISFDYQYSNKSRDQDENSITLFQFCSSKGVLLIQRDPLTTVKNDKLLNFMISNKFFAKTTKRDYIKFEKVFGDDATKIAFEDITRTRLLANGFSSSFDDMVDRFCEKKQMFQFDTKRLQRSNWDSQPLNMMQVLFAGFRVLALYNSMKKFPEPNMSFVSEDPNVPIPIQYIQGISRIEIKPKLKYMLIYDLRENTILDLTKIIGLKQTFRYIYMFTKNGETNDKNEPFDKAIIEVENLIEFRKKIKKAQSKISPIDSSLWEIGG